MKRIITLAIFCTLFGLNNLFSQNSGHVSVSYDMSFGVGNLSDYISKPSFRGVSGQYRFDLKNNLLLGAELGFNTFYEKKEKDSYTYQTHTITGVQYRFQNQVPIFVSADYIFLSKEMVKIYFGLGVGTLYTQRTTDMGIWRFQENTWQFAVKPEIGFLYEVSGGNSLKLGLKYYSGFKSDTMDGQGYFAISAGFAFGL